MVDNISISLEVKPPRQAFKRKEFLLNGNLLFVPFFNHNAELTRFAAKHKNLDIRLYPNAGKVLIKNSLAKYRNTNNYQDLTAKQIEETIYTLSDELHLDVTAGEIKGIEYGCVTQPQSLNKAINSPLSHRGKMYEDMTEKGHKYGSKCRYMDYSIKGYDKTFEAKKHEGITAPEGLFRWEIAAKYMRYLNKRSQPINLYKAADLFNPEILQYLANDLVEKYHNTMKKETIDYYELTPNELNVALRMQHIPEVIKEKMPHTYKKDKRLFKAITAKYSDTGAFDRIERQMIEKCRELINS